MDELGLNCSVCEEFYSRRNPPRNIGCGHSVCSLCAYKILSADKKCPECRQEIKGKNVSEMAINQPLLQLALSLLPSCPDEIEEEQLMPSAPPLDTSMGEPNISRNQTFFESCPEHPRHQPSRCMVCKVWFCEICDQSSHADPPRGECKVLPFSMALQNMKYTCSESLKSKQHFAEKLKRRIEKENSIINAVREQKNRVLYNLQLLLQEVDTINKVCVDARCDMLNESSELQNLVTLLTGGQDIVKRAKTIEEMDGAMKMINDAFTLALKFQNHKNFKMPKMTSLNPQKLRSIVEVYGKGVYTLHTSESGQVRWAKLTIRNGLIHLHDLQDSDEQPNGILLKYEDVRELVSREFPSVFMDISNGSSSSRRVYIRMFGNTVRGQQAIYLCSGEKGPSYKGSCFYRSENLNEPLEIIRGGNYASNNGTGGKAIVGGITNGGVYTAEITPGLVVGWRLDDHWRLGSFNIYLGTYKGHHDKHAFGIVTQGIEILRAAARHQPIQECKITDCGVVIPV